MGHYARVLVETVSPNRNVILKVPGELRLNLFGI